MIIPAVLIFLFIAPLNADEQEYPKVGLALSGGGMRGIAHIGVLRRLEEEGVKINTIAGSSMGALIGSLYALGYDTYELENIIKDADANEIFRNKPERNITENYLKKTADRTVVELEFTDNGIELPNALNNGHRVLKKLRKIILSSEHYSDDFDKMKYSLRVVCSDIQNGEKVVFSNGDLPTIVLGSISFPGLFKPVVYKGMKLLDGGLTDNLPTEVIKECDIIIASNMTHDTPSKDEEYNFIELLDRISLTMTQTNIAKSIDLADIVLTPELYDIRFGEIENPDSLIAIGYRETDKSIERILDMVGSKTLQNFKYDKKKENDIVFSGNSVFSDNDLFIEVSGIKENTEYIEKIRSKYRKSGYLLAELKFKKGQHKDTIDIDEGILKKIHLKGNEDTKGTFIRGELSVSENTPAQISELEKSIDNLYGTGLFYRVTYILDYEKKEVTFHLEENPYNLIRIGANYQTDRGFLGLFELSNKNVHGKRAEIYSGFTYGEKYNRLELSYYNPFLKRSTLFFEILPYAQIKQKEFYDEDYKKLAERTFKERRAGLNLNLGFQFFDNYQGTLGLMQEKIDYKNEYYDKSSLFFSVLADSRNDNVVPSEGLYFFWNMETGMIDYDNNKKFQKIWWEMSIYGNIMKRLNMELGVCAGTGDKLVPVYEKYPRGGIDTMPGTYFDQFSKAQYFTVKTKQSFLIRKSVVFDTYFSAGYFLNGFWDSPEIEWSYRDFTSSFYAGIILNTTLAPVQSGWGITLGNGDIKANNRFFLSVGYSLNR